MDFGTNLAAFRKQKNITQQALSDATGFDKRMISRWEGGNTKPNIEAAISIAKSLNVSLDILAGLTKDDSSEADNLLDMMKKLSKSDLNAMKHIVERLSKG